MDERTSELLKKVRKIEIKTRGLSNQIFSGGYHSAFKGRGMSFSEVRAYQYGDDVRNIDWNVTARFRDPYVKVFEEEREITVMLVVDISPSTLFGTQANRENIAQLKQEIMTEICAVLAFSATNNNDKVGLILFSGDVEKFVPPKKGRNHILRIIRELLDARPLHQGTNIAEALRYLTNMLKKRSIVFVLSDFINSGPEYKDALSIARRRHDVVGLHVYDDRERSLPNVGLVRVMDAETGEEIWLDTAQKATREHYAAWFEQNLGQTRERFLRSGADFVSMNIKDSYITALMNLFSMREKRR
ncbi:MAG: DUF58 domain-containing protein [Bacteroidetes bacterium]|nr:MAG: DUF58 domain-containing protein [Bacteroidota bacterium]